MTIGEKHVPESRNATVKVRNKYLSSRFPSAIVGIWPHKIEREGCYFGGILLSMNIPPPL